MRKRAWWVSVPAGELLALVACIPLLCGFGVLEKRDPEVETGNASLKAGKPDDALVHYDRAVKALPADAGAHFDRGAALYALSRFDEAGQEFLRATEAKDGTLKAAAFYNLGNAFFKKDKFKEAVAAYTRSLGLRPDDQQAKWNLEIALRKQKEEEKKQQDQKDKDKQKEKDQKDDKKKDDQQNKDQKDKKDDKKDDQKKQDPSKQDPGKNKQDQDGNKDQSEQPKPSSPEEQKQIESVLDNLERSSKDLEKERARVRAVRTAPPAKDW